MRLTPQEMDRLTIFVAAELARRRLNKGVKLNYPESVALICDEVLEQVRAGKSYAEVLKYAGQILSIEDVLPGVAEMITLIQVEASFPDGTKLLTIRNPIQLTSRKGGITL